jgi:hypothetical protein
LHGFEILTEVPLLQVHWTDDHAGTRHDPLMTSQVRYDFTVSLIALTKNEGKEGCDGN